MFDNALVDAEDVVGDDEKRSCDAFELGLLKHRPNLKAYACSLARNPDVADDLVQETMIRALAYRHRFDETTNQRAWLFTILKNLFRSNLRKSSRETPLTEGVCNRLLRTTQDPQECALFLREVLEALAKLPKAQLRALVLVVFQGCSVEDAAKREGCAAGTIKSRVSRARSALMAKTF